LRLRLSSWPYSWSKDSFIALMLLVCLAFAGWSSSAVAQTQPPVSLSGPALATLPVTIPTGAMVLTDQGSSYDATSHIFYTRDPTGNLGGREIYIRHRNNLRGEQLGLSPVNFSFDGASHWLVMDIINNSSKSDWVLDFGTMGEGRTGLAKQIFIQDAGRGTTLVDTSGDLLPKGHSVFLRLLPGQQSTLVIFMTATDHAPFLISPKIIEATELLQGQGIISETVIRNSLLIIVAATTLFFLGGMFLRRGSGFFPHALFFLTQGAWLWLTSGYIYAPVFGNASLPGIALASGGLFALASTQSIIAAQENETSDSLILYICASFVVLAMMLFMFVTAENSAMRIFVITGSTVLAYVVAAFKAMTVPRDMRWTGRLAGAAWIVMLFGSILSYMAAFGMLPPIALFLQAPAMLMPLVCVLMVLSGTWYVRAGNIDLVREILRQTKRAEAVSKLKASKETADQARLLRVIEREREIMEDLRAREAERTEEMRLSKITADEANRAKSAFLAVVSHEIRTPMTGIMGMLRLLLDTEMTREQKDYAQTIQDSGDAMLALLNDILDFSKIEGGGLSLESIDFDLHRVVGSVAMLMNGHASQRNIYLNTDIDVDAPRFLKGDPTRMRQVLLNLVGNAIKFTARGGVTIAVRTGDQSFVPADKPGLLPVKISVSDTGIGISEEAQKNLFNPFSQADSSIARKFGGTGLGLAICRRLVQAMGSDIELQSTEGHGTTFTFTVALPAGDQKNAQADGRTGDTPSLPTNLAKPMEILVVDDNAVNRKVMEGLLARDGHRVFSVAGGKEALEILTTKAFQLVFMDIEMPGMNGLEALRLMMEHDDKRVGQTPVVALTGNVAEDDKLRYKNAGMKDVLAKPIDPERLRNILLAHGHAAAPAPLKPQPPAPVTVDFSTSELDEDTFSGSVEYTTATRTHIEETPLKAIMPSARIEEYVPQPPAPKPAETQVPTDLPADLFNMTTITSLKTSLGAHQLREMLDGVFAHNRSVMPTLQTAFNDGDTETMRGCAHELKGMNGNFGLARLAELSGIIEKSCRDGTVQFDAMDDIIFHQLPAAMEATERAFRTQ